jgi:hypothetical protein
VVVRASKSQALARTGSQALSGHMKETEAQSVHLG